MEITLKIKKDEVYDKVAQSTEYVGDRMTDDADAYERIRVIDTDSDELERFWNESRADLMSAFELLQPKETIDGDNYWLTIYPSDAFNTYMVPVMEVELVSFFVQSIMAKWFAYTNKKEAADYAAVAAGTLEALRLKAPRKTFVRRLSLY